MSLARRVLREPQALPVLPVRRELLVILVLKEIPEKRALRAPPELQGLPAPKVLPVLPEQPELKDPLALLEILEHKVPPELPVPRVRKVLLE